MELAVSICHLKIWSRYQHITKFKFCILHFKNLDFIFSIFFEGEAENIRRLKNVGQMAGNDVCLQSGNHPEKEIGDERGHKCIKWRNSCILSGKNLEI